jgi:hypothetical protein
VVLLRDLGLVLAVELAVLAPGSSLEVELQQRLDQVDCLQLAEVVAELAHLQYLVRLVVLVDRLGELGPVELGPVELGPVEPGLVVLGRELDLGLGLDLGLAVLGLLVEPGPLQLEQLGEFLQETRSP